MGSLLVSHEPASAAVVRQTMTRDLTRWLPEPAVDEVVLVASELVGNAIRHAPPNTDRRLQVEWDVDDANATVRVSDSGTGIPQVRSATLDEPSGRGLAIVDAVSAEWGFYASGHGKFVWARVPIERSRRAAS
ncbi:MAG TPA: ATP-binding protein [Jatrophihabitantaceae bacterium]|nr:ATP-binding protein [Jatrophihabitantaceae bacterium]